MPTPSELVTESFALAQNYVTTNEVKLISWLDKLENAVQITPLIDLTFNPVADPGSSTPAPYVPASEYSSAIVTLLTSSLLERLAGGTGLPVAVEALLWDRARERELATAQAAIDQISNDSEALGFVLPTGVLVDSIRRETRAYYDKASTLSRDIAAKQADLEQVNMHKSIEQSIQFEQGLADVNFKRSQVVLDAYRAEILRFEAEVKQDLGHWEAEIKQYEAQINYIFNGQKLNSEIVRANTAGLMDAAKVGAQVYAQLQASAYSIIHTSAGVSASSGMTVGYSYGNDTIDQPPAVTSI